MDLIVCILKSSFVMGLSFGNGRRESPMVNPTGKPTLANPAQPATENAAQGVANV